MKKISTLHWTINDDTEGLLFFAQRLDEMLAHNTIDTYKASALNTVLLFLEARQLISYIESGSIDKKNLKHVIEEINWAYKADLVLAKLLGDSIKLYFPFPTPIQESNNPQDDEKLNKGEISNINDIKLKLEILLNKISPRKYIESLKALLVEAAKDKHKKREINFLTNSLVTSLTSLGYHQSYLYTQTKAFFFNPDKPINNNEVIGEFLSKFDFNFNSYQVVFIASKTFLEMKNTCEKLKTIKIRTRLNNQLSKTEEGVILKEAFDKNKNCYVIIDNIEAHDEFSARQLAGKIIRKIADYFSYFHHRASVYSLPKALVKNKKNDEFFIIANSESPMKKGYRPTEKKAEHKLNSFIFKFSLEGKSSILFDRAIDMHGLAVKDYASENQILNMWISIESLIPKNSSRNTIDQIVDSLVPFLTLNYIKKLINDVAYSLARDKRYAILKITKKLPPEVNGGLVNKIASLVACDEFEPLRKELYRMLDDYPLLRFRIYMLHEQIKSAEKILELIETHKKKVQWHIRRIYRSRNLVVHEGITPYYIEILIENAHTYLDTFLNMIINLALTKQIRTLEQGTKEIEILATNQEKFLKEQKNVACDKDNFEKFLYG